MTVALVTGANRGIGLEICRQLADRDLEVVLTARGEAKARAGAERLWGEGLDTVHPRVVDVTSGASVERLRGQVERDFGRLDVLVNNAGVYPDRGRPALEADPREVHEILDVNALGALRMAAAFAPLMRAGGGGRIVNVSSSMGQLAEMGAGALGYRMSKAAMNVVTRVLAAELAGDRILVNSASPGWVRTEMGGAAATRSVGEGAGTPVWLATLPDDGPSGRFFRDRTEIPF